MRIHQIIVPCLCGAIQASMLTSMEEETPPSSSSEVFQAEMNNLRMTKLMLEEELTKLQTQVT